jgi:hypothetical protein
MNWLSLGNIIGLCNHIVMIYFSIRTFIVNVFGSKKQILKLNKGYSNYVDREHIRDTHEGINFLHVTSESYIKKNKPPV